MAPETAMRPKAYSYLRFSRPEQARGDSERRQMQMAEEYATRNGLDLDATLRLDDRGTSAFRGANADVGALKEFRRAIEAGGVAPGSYLLVENLDRLSRQEPWDAIGPIREIIEAGITVVTVSDGTEYSRETLRGGMGGMMALMGMLFTLMRAHEESAQKARRVRAAWNGKRAKALKDGHVLTKRCPAWMEYDEETGTFQLIPERAPIVLRIFEDTLSGQGQNAIAKALNAEGVPTWGDTGRKPAKHWHRSYIAKILNNPAAMGTFFPHTQTYEDARKVRTPQEPIPGYYPAAITEQLWEDVQALRATRSPQRGRNAGQEVRNVFGGLLICGACGGTATRVYKGNKRGRGEYLVCQTAKTGAGCDYRSVPYQTVEQAFLKSSKGLLSDPPSGDEHLAGEIDRVGTLLLVGQEQVETLLDEIQAGNGSQSLRQRLEKVEAEIERYREEWEALRELRARTGQPMIEHRVEQLREALVEEPLDRTKLNTLLRQAFRSVTLDAQAGTLTFEWQQGGTTEIWYAFPQEKGA
jgi:DNA invertase Pin-like site-specific DNA recombinase